jgi:hypothetical protein
MVLPRRRDGGAVVRDVARGGPVVVVAEGPVPRVVVVVPKLSLGAVGTAAPGAAAVVPAVIPVVVVSAFSFSLSLLGPKLAKRLGVVEVVAGAAIGEMALGAPREGAVRVVAGFPVFRAPLNGLIDGAVPTGIVREGAVVVVVVVAGLPKLNEGGAVVVGAVVVVVVVVIAAGFPKLKPERGAVEVAVVTPPGVVVVRLGRLNVGAVVVVVVNVVPAGASAGFVPNAEIPPNMVLGVAPVAPAAAGWALKAPAVEGAPNESEGVEAAVPNVLPAGFGAVAPGPNKVVPVAG